MSFFSINVNKVGDGLKNIKAHSHRYGNVKGWKIHSLCRKMEDQTDASQNKGSILKKD